MPLYKKKPTSKYGYDRVDLIYAYAHQANPSVSYLTAWRADRKISKNYWLWPDENMEVRITKGSDPKPIKSKDWTIGLPIPYLMRGITRRKDPSSLIFKDVYYNYEGHDHGDVVDEQYWKDQGLRAEDATVNNARASLVTEVLDPLNTMYVTKADSGMDSTEPFQDYSLALKHIYRLIQTSEFNLKGARAQIGSMFGWKQPTGINKIKSIIDAFLEEAEKENLPYLDQNRFEKIKENILKSISSPSKNRDTKTTEVYDKIKQILAEAHPKEQIIPTATTIK